MDVKTPTALPALQDGVGTPKKVGLVALVGRPNAGKSTFVNALLGEKVSIVSQVPQTTRKALRGIWTDERCQAVFMDVPGIHDTQKEWNGQINEVAIRALRDADVILRFMDASRPWGPEEDKIEAYVKAARKPVVRVLSKTDLERPDAGRPAFPDALRLCSLQEKGLKEVLEAVVALLPDGNQLYPDDVYTDQDSYTRCGEIIREHVFLMTQDELPHATFVDVVHVDEDGPLLRVQAFLCPETDSQKAILIGAGGEKIKRIATKSRLEMEKIFGRKCFLDLKVRVRKNWRKDKALRAQALN